MSCYSVGTRSLPRDQHSARSRLGQKLWLKISEGSSHYAFELKRAKFISDINTRRRVLSLNIFLLFMLFTVAINDLFPMAGKNSF